MRYGTAWQRLLACVSAGAALVWATASPAQAPQYESEAALMGAAIASPEGVGQVLDRLVQKCGLYGEATKARGNAALRSWQMRHRDYLAQGQRVRAELAAVYTEPEAKQRFDDLLENQFPRLVERQFVVYSNAIDDQPTQAAKAELCDGYFKAVDDRQFDLTVNDPALAAFFDKRIAAERASSATPPPPPPASSPASSPAGSAGSSPVSK
ncbi:hypothetical protein PAN31108_04184 [Pandoraea anhela]|uniref:Uncharacterized protein n=1 Tax=Pandoraea anhela TaxID=2508295 RepID=A0A5E4XZU9_9BURK|nr:hypothetical protein PAN31108_04184 [Pandoraea anhela]